MASKRLVHLDAARAAAALAIVVMHVTPLGRLDAPAGSADWRIMIAVNSLLRWAVPVFFMISGALFLDPERLQPVKKLWGKSILRLMVSFLFWSALYGAWYALTTGHGKWTMLNQTLRGHYHMWTILTIIGLYAVTPILRPAVADRRIARYILALGIGVTFVCGQALTVLQSLPLPHADVIASAASLYGQLNPYRALTPVVYFVLGHELSANPPGKRARRLILACGALGVIATFALTQWHSRITGGTSSAFYETTSVTVLMSAVAAFELFRIAGARLSAHPAACRVVTRLSVCSFGVYLAHPFLLERLIERFPAFPAGALPLWLTIPLASVCIYAAAFALCALIRKIPAAGKYIV